MSELPMSKYAPRHIMPSMEYLRGVAPNDLSGQIQNIVSYQDTFDTQVQARALATPAAFVKDYNEFIRKSVQSFTANADLLTTNNFMGALKAYADHMGYSGSINELIGEIIIFATKAVADSIVGKDRLEEAIDKLRVKSN